MSTEDMPTTNQNPDNMSLANKIPPTVAAGFQKAASSVGNVVVNKAKSSGAEMNT